jgi:hypothetical protein
MAADKVSRKIFISALKRKKIIAARLKSYYYQAHPDPIIMLGNQKSGTTVISALLSMLTGKPATLDIPPLWHSIEGLITEKQDLANFIKNYSFYFSNPIIKEPWLSFIPDQVRSNYPESRFILIMRNPYDNIRSILDRLEMPGHLDTNPDNISSLAKGWKEAFKPELYGLPQTSGYIEVLCKRWNLTAEIPMRQNMKDIVIIKYEDFIADKKNAILGLADKIGEKEQYDLCDEVNRQFQKPGKKRYVYQTEFFGGDNSETIYNLCKNNMSIYGYER